MYQFIQDFDNQEIETFELEEICEWKKVLSVIERNQHFTINHNKYDIFYTFKVTI